MKCTQISMIIIVIVAYKSNVYEPSVFNRKLGVQDLPVNTVIINMRKKNCRIKLYRPTAQVIKQTELLVAI